MVQRWLGRQSTNMADFPLLFTVGHKAYVGAGEDSNGNEIPTYAPVVTRPVYGWGAPQRSEPKLAGHNREVVEVELLVPPEFDCKARDILILEGDEHEVIGGPEMFDHNPFGWNPGGVINLRRSNG